ncbi:SHOCT domain-containing protein [Krasilnikovia sp. M28-CT-15]|uniref:SHOCT domain-containing protein n=1 Tax=Krasilnikovia sp. M28-CT-15 TaxID=3373540 RepID=UPI003876E62A
MMYWGTGMGTWGMTLMTISSLLFWGLIIAGIVVLVRYLSRDLRPVGPAPGATTPQQILAERFARGEINEAEYTSRLHRLDAPPPADRPGD